MSHPDYRLNLRPLGTPRGVSSLVGPHGVGASPGDKKSKNKTTRGKKKSIFETYMSKEDVSEGLKRGTLIQGVLRINPKKFHEAFIPSPDGDRDIFIDGVVARNRALNGDLVVVKLLPEEQWKGFVGCMDISNDQDGHSCCSHGSEDRTLPLIKWSVNHDG
ncbi:hypothetical protein FD754_004230 [Muntiacus muntjak]|uniref:CSD1 domain-containing protein n=1 Tax=Muntiacus muntjak TaxID=9888 RepID=A0A5N3WF25_MUNMU|nr:hypothetical protein FD754_004230 [Muntiacus muntjak]